VVDVHADEFISQVAAHIARVLKGVLDGFVAVVEAVLDAGGEDVRNSLSDFGFEAFVNHIATEREGQAIVFAAPPCADVFANLQPFFLVSELAFVNDQADVCFSGLYGVEDLVEGNNDVIDFTRALLQPKLQREKRAGHGAGDGDGAPGDFVAGKFLFCDEHRSVAVAHARATGQERVFVAYIGVGMNADRGDVEFAARGALVEGLDVLEDVFETEVGGWDEIFRQGIEHERIIRIGRMAEGECQSKFN